MTTFVNAHFWLVAMLLLVFFALLLIGFAVCISDYVESDLRFLSFGFRLKARNRGKNQRT